MSTKPIPYVKRLSCIAKALLAGFGSLLVPTFSYAQLGTLLNGTAYNLSSDFSITTNPNGAWTYGYKVANSTVFKPFTEIVKNAYGVSGFDRWNAPSMAEPMIMRNNTNAKISWSTVRLDGQKIVLHPGRNLEQAVARWTAPSTGTWKIDAVFRGADVGPTTTRVSILQNNTALFNGEVNSFENGPTYSNSITVAAGDVIDFVVDPKGLYSNDSTELNVTIGNGTVSDTKLTFNKSSYQRFDTAMSWKNAKAFCESNGAHLATVTSQGEHDFIVNNFVSSSVPIIWLGGTDEVKEGSWQWVTGEPWSYTNWSVSPRNPDNNPSVGGQNYLAIQRGMQNQWDDLQTAEQRPFVCEWDDLTSVQNQAPTVSVGQVNQAANGDITLTFSVSDPEGQSVGSSVYLLGANGTVMSTSAASKKDTSGKGSGTTQTVSWTAAEAAAAGFVKGSSYSIGVDGVDNQGLKSTTRMYSANFAWVGVPVVNQAPTVSIGQVNQAANGDITLTFSVSDPEGQSVGSSVYLLGANGTVMSTSAASKKDTSGKGSGTTQTVSWTAAEAAAAGFVKGSSYSIGVDGVDNQGLKSATRTYSANFTWSGGAAITKLTFNKSSYQRFDTAMSWKNAKAFCESNGAHLATVTSQGEHDFIVTNFVSSSVPIIWLGGTDEVKEGSWQWVTGEPWSYTNWSVSPRNPDNNPSVGGQNYLAIQRGMQNQWDDLQTAEQRPFVCEWDDLTSVQNQAPTVSVGQINQAANGDITLTFSVSDPEGQSVGSSVYLLGANGTVMSTSAASKKDTSGKGSGTTQTVSWTAAEAAAAGFVKGSSYSIGVDGVDNQGLKSTTRMYSANFAWVGVPVVSVTRNPDHFFTAVEKLYPDLFPRGYSSTQKLSSFIYRYYPSTGNYLGVSDGKIYVYGPITGNKQQEFGFLESMFCQFSPNAINCPENLEKQTKLLLLEKVSPSISRSINGRLFYQLNNAKINVKKLDDNYVNRLSYAIYLRNLSMMQGPFASLDAKYIEIDQVRTKEQAAIELVKSVAELVSLGIKIDKKPETDDILDFSREYYTLIRPMLITNTTSVVNALTKAHDDPIFSENQMDAIKGVSGFATGLMMFGANNSTSGRAGVVGGIADLLKAQPFADDDVAKKIIDSVSTLIQCQMKEMDTCIINASELTLKGISDYKAAIDLMLEARNTNAIMAARQYIDAWYSSGFDADFMAQQYGIPASIADAAQYFDTQYINGYYKNSTVVELFVDGGVTGLYQAFVKPFRNTPFQGIDQDIFKDTVNEYIRYTNNQVRHYQNDLGLISPTLATVIVEPSSNTPLENGRVGKRGERITVQANLKIADGYSVESAKWLVHGADSASALQSSTPFMNGKSTADFVFSSAAYQKVLVEMQIVGPDGAASKLTGTFSLAVSQ